MMFSTFLFVAKKNQTDIALKRGIYRIKQTSLRYTCRNRLFAYVVGTFDSW